MSDPRRVVRRYQYLDAGWTMWPCKENEMPKGNPKTTHIGGVSIDVPVPPGREARYFNVGDEVEFDSTRIALFAEMYEPNLVALMESLTGQTGTVMGHDRLSGWPETCQVAFVNGPQVSAPHDLWKSAHV